MEIETSIKESKLEFSDIKETREVLLSMKIANKAILKKNKNYSEDYNIVIAPDKVTLNYSIVERKKD
jgi:hypothetical protein